MTTSSVQDYKIGLTWDGKPIDHRPAQVFSSNMFSSLDFYFQISLRPGPGGEVLVSVVAPYWSDPAPPGGLPGQAYFGLWEYEVVEAFFLNSRDQYLEVEFGPHGQHIVLLLNGRRNAVK